MNAANLGTRPGLGTGRGHAAGGGQPLAPFWGERTALTDRLLLQAGPGGQIASRSLIRACGITFQRGLRRSSLNSMCGGERHLSTTRRLRELE